MTNPCIDCPVMQACAAANLRRLKRGIIVATALVIGAVALMLGLAGCTSTYIKGDGWELRRISVLQRNEIKSVRVNPRGEYLLEGYSNEGGGDAAGAVVEGAVKGLRGL